jgi:hypothetical protein
MTGDLSRAFDEAGLPSGERLRFFDLCEARSREELHADVARIEAHLGALRSAAAHDPTVDLSTAEQIATALARLIRSDWRFEERRLLAGAVSYFVLRDDSSDDLDDLRGIDDDARVVRAVCRALGRDDLAQQI